MRKAGTTINGRIQELVDNTTRLLTPEKIESISLNLLLSLLVLVFTYVIIKLLSYVLDRTLKPGRPTSEPEESSPVKPVFSDNLIHTFRFFLKALILYGGYLVAVIVILEIFNVKMITPEDLKALGVNILKIIGILIGAKLVINLGQLAIKQIFEQHDNGDDLIANRRVQTLYVLLRSVMTYLVFFVAGLMILQIFNVNTSAILASAGILGLAVGFGAQNIVKDVVSGFFILFEDQFSIGDFVEAAGVIGTVEEIGLRTCKIRQWTGQLHIIPNGEISMVTNYNRGKMIAQVTVGIAYEEDIDRAVKVLQDASEKAYHEIEAILDVPLVQGVTELADSSVNIRTIAPTKPGEHWAVERELRRRFKYALEQNNIEIPYPRRVIIDHSRTR